jgi:hypothetical protein
MSSINDYEEIWKPCTRSLDYSVSNFGRIKSYKHTNDEEGHILSQSFNKHNGYYSIRLGRKIAESVHVLVAEAFLGPRPSSNHVVNHKDGNKQNNRDISLEWITKSEDVTHQYDAGLRDLKPRFYPIRGGFHPLAKLTDEEVNQIRISYKLGLATSRDLAIRYGVTQGWICKIIHDTVR